MGIIKMAEDVAKTPGKTSESKTLVPVAPPSMSPNGGDLISTDGVGGDVGTFNKGGAVGGVGAGPGQAGPTKRIGDRLVERGLITGDQLKVALHEKQKSPKLIGEILVDLGFISSDVLSQFIAESTGLVQFDPKKTIVDPDALELMTKKDAQKYQVLPVSLDRVNNRAVIAMVDPYDVVASDKLKQLLPKGCIIQPQICPPATMGDAIHKAYGVSTSIDAILNELAGDKNAAKKNLDTLSDAEAYSHPLVRLVNALIFEAVKMGASDLHFEPEENFIRLRWRIDGDMVTTHTLHKEYWNGICQRLKILAQLNIADKLSPQDGRFNLVMGAKEADFRVSCLPTVHGENIVLRVLDKSSSIVPLEKLGFSEHNLKLIKKSCARPEGIIIVTGPTGSGKTTTLYSMLNDVNTPDVNIQTLEDPVEYNLGMIRQTHVRDNGSFTFGEGIKALLRQDPDIIFIGEVRDQVTAEQALKAAMTGHQVFTSLHTNDCFGAFPRLFDLNLKPTMVAGAVIATFAQRLVRKLCQKCKKPVTATPEECKLLVTGPDDQPIDPSKPPTIYAPGGCPECNNTGYKGRIACVEILYMDEELDNIIAGGGLKAELRAAARKKGFKAMIDDGILKIYQGTTTLDAVTKILNFADRM
ncbi:MAG: type II/IV secretion system protein [Alphaproteobacteria bacterium]|nr:MAG: type II/IV secretion system protein [Alphaproteobacteria bacterium]